MADSIATDGGPAATIGTVSRGVPTSQALTVSLTSSTPSAVSVPASVVIPAGQTSANFVVDATPGNSTIGDQLVTITAKAEIGDPLSKDSSFSTRALSFNGAAATTQWDGKIIAAGSVYTTSSNFAVQRFNADGSPDATFNNGLAAVLGMTGRSMVGKAVAVQADGKILVGGYFQDQGSSTWNMQLARLTADGRLDSSFGTGGWVTLIPTSGFYNEIWDLAVLSDGKILIGGSIYNSSTSNDFAVVRLNSIGSLDSTFGSGGYATTSFSNGSDRGYKLAVQPDGKILLAGSSFGGNASSTFAVARWTSDGRLDSAFGSGGKLATDVPGNYDEARGVAVQPDGKILVAGSSSNGMTMVRYSAAGTLDASFGTGGIVTKSSATSTTSMVAQSDVGIVVGGSNLSRFSENGDELASVATSLVDAIVTQGGRKIVALSHSSSTSYLDGYIASFPAVASDTVIVTSSPALKAVGDTYTAQKATQLTVAAPGVLANDENSAGGTLTAVMVTGAKYGSAGLGVNGYIMYRPKGAFLGQDSFTYRVSNGTSTSNVATVTLNVVGANDAPTAGAESYELVVSGQTKELQVQSPGVLSNDGDPNSQAIAAVLDSAPASGKVVLNSDGSFVYTPNAGFYGVDRFTYRASDGELTSPPTTVTISVYGQPTAVADTYSVIQDTVLSVPAPGVVANDVSPAGLPLRAVISVGPKSGLINLNDDGSFTYTPQAGFVGQDTFKYYVTDGKLLSATATSTINVTFLNKPPVAGDDAYNYRPGTPLLVGAPGVLANDQDPNGQAITAALVTPPAHGSLTLNSDGSFTYTPAAGWSGADAFTYKVGDGELQSAAATVQLLVASPSVALWTQRGGDAGHSGYIDARLDASGITAAWFQPLTYVVNGFAGNQEIAIDGARVYVTSLDINKYNNYHIMAFDRPTGALVWDQIIVGNGPVSAPTVVDGKVYVNRSGHSGISGGTDNDKPWLYVLDAGTGAVLQRQTYSAQWDSDERPVIEGGQIIAPDGYYGGFSAWSTSTMTRQWNNTGPQLEDPLAALDAKYVYAYDDQFYLRSTGAYQGKIAPPTGMGWIGSPVVSDSGRLLFNVRDSENYATKFGISSYDAQTRTPRWTVTLPASPAGKAVGGGVVVVTAGKQVFFFDESTGTQLGVWNAPDNLNSQIVLTRNYAFVEATNSTSSHVYAINLATGKSDWTYENRTRGYRLGTTMEMAIGGGRLVLRNDAFLAAFLLPDAPPTTATYAGSDATTRGTWASAYGAGGYALAGSADTLGSAFGLGLGGVPTYTWQAGSSDPRGLEQPQASGRILAGWYKDAFTVAVDAGTTPQKVSLYFVDADGGGRSQRVEVLDAATGAVLDTRVVSDFGGGVYLTWTLSGEAKFRITRLGGPNAVLSGVFVGGGFDDGGHQESATASYEGSDATTQGAWDSAYGAGGYALAGSADTLGAAFSSGDTAAYTWQAGGYDPRGLADPLAQGRLLAAWYKDTFSVSLDAGATAKRVSLYFVDADGGGRSQRVEVLDAATGAVLDDRTVSDFSGGVYLTWTLSGKVSFRITRIGGPNAVLSGVFVDGAQVSVPTAAYKGSDATTRGDWASAYGAGGYAMAASGNTLGASAGFGVAASTYTWQAGSADPRGLADPLASGRLLAAWYKDAFTVTLDAGSAPKQASLYFLDADGGGRSQRVEVLDATTGAVLDARDVSDFSGGVYLTWTLSGKVSFRITRIGGPNAVLSGLFID
ncbi:Ig-like domain-containing protein [Paludisphaera rhizosphaerae]|uniref:Ig-like domain-containing protein n=1 Tax=Paludisphaera rhizosphaerae TaxID=2711216 RepID=UPI0013EDB24C|nr:Ig-like domain-containing protein [Paludisphaera rhizosphaerae]